MSAREDVERLLAEHYSPDLCVRRGHFPSTAPMVAAHVWHLAEVLDEAGLLADEGAVSDTWDAAREAGYAEALIEVEHLGDREARQ